MRGAEAEKVVDGDPGVAVRVLRGGVTKRIRTRTWLRAAVRYAVVGVVCALLGAALALWWIDHEAAAVTSGIERTR